MGKAINFNVLILILIILISIVTVNGNDYKIYFMYISKDEIINLLRNIDLTEKAEH